jgi:hypothetical protein
MLHNIDNQYCMRQEMGRIQKEYHQNSQLVGKSVRIASEQTSLIDLTDVEWQVTAEGMKNIKINSL